MEIRELTAAEIPALMDCYMGLVRHHNAVSPPPFTNIYPTLDPAVRLRRLAEDVEAGRAFVDGLFDGGRPVGFVSISIDGELGDIDQLYVEPACRGQGWGDQLMRRALDRFQAAGVTLTDVCVVDGNPAMDFYARYGFTRRLTILSRRDGGDTGK